MTHWYVVHTLSKAEERALWHLRQQGFHCFLPRIVELRRHARQLRQVLAPLFPRYLFVSFDLDATRWRSINGTRGVVNLLASGGCPLRVPEGATEALCRRCDERGVAPLTALSVFTTGLTVRIKSGAFLGKTGEIAEILTQEYDRVRVLLNFLSAQTSLELPSYAVEAV